MQGYSIVKGKSRSDDGIERLPKYPVGERKTISDDGFESFPEYCFDGRLQDDNYEKYSDHSENNPREDAKIQPDEPSTEPASLTMTAKKKRRRPITPKNKRKNRKDKGKAADVENGIIPNTLSESHKAPNMESDDEADAWEPSTETHEKRSSSRTTLLSSPSTNPSTQKAMIKVAEYEEFEFEAETVGFIERYKEMTHAQQQKELLGVLESLLE